MKNPIKTIVSVLILSVLSIHVNAFKFYIPEGNKYRCEAWVDGSINDRCNALGYGENMYYIYSNYKVEGSDIFNIIFKSFSDDIILIVTEDIVTEDIVLELTPQDVCHYLKDFNLKEEFNYSQYEESLQRGIENRTIKYPFIASALGMPEKPMKNVLDDDRYGYRLYFEDDYLVKYENLELYDAFVKEFRDYRKSEFTAMGKLH